MNDIRGILKKLEQINETTEVIQESDNLFHWGITDPAEIKAHVIANLVDWHHGNGWENGTFAELLAAYLSALKINANESQLMKQVIKSALKVMVEDYKIWLKEDRSLSFADEMKTSIAKLRQMGVEGKELDAIENDLNKREQRSR